MKNNMKKNNTVFSGSIGTGMNFMNELRLTHMNEKYAKITIIDPHDKSLLAKALENGIKVPNAEK